MKFRIFIFFVWISCFNIASSYEQYQEFGNEYQQRLDRPIHANYIRNIPGYPAHSQSFNHALPSQINYASHASHPEPQYASHQKPETFVEKDTRVYEHNAESSAPAKPSHEHKTQVYIPQPHQELPRPYPVDKTFELHVSQIRPDDTQHVPKPWVLQNTYQPTIRQEPYYQRPVQPEPYYQPPVLQEPYQPPVHQEPYHQPFVYSEPQPSVYQHSTPLQHAQPQHPTPSQHAQPQHAPPTQQAQAQHPLPPQRPTPHQQAPPQQTYYKPQPSYAVPAAIAQAEAYATSETKVADILASKSEVNDYLESALFKRYQLDDLGNLHHVKSSDVKLEENDYHIGRTTEKPHNNHQNNKRFKNQLLDNDDLQNKKLHVPQKNNHIVNLQTVSVETKHETIPPKNYDNESLFAYQNNGLNPPEVKIFPIEVKPVNPHLYRKLIVKHHSNTKQPDNIQVNEQEKPTVPSTPLGNTNDSYPIESQHSKIYEASALKDEVTLYDHDLHDHEQRSKKQPELKPYADKIHPVNDNIPPIQYSKIPSHSTPTDQILIDNVDPPLHGINKPKDSFDDVTPLQFYSDTIDDTKAPSIASPNSNYDKPSQEFYSNLQIQPEVAKPTTNTNNGNIVTNPIVSQKEDSEKETVTEIDVTKAIKIDDKQQTINENVSGNGDKQHKAESEPRPTVPKDIAKEYPIEGSPLNADSPSDDETLTEDENLQNDDCTSGEADPDTNGYDVEATESENDINAVLLSSIDLWEKLLSKQPNMEFQAFTIETLSPIVEKTSRLFAFPNHTTVEESVETVWERKGDKLPLEIKLTTIIKNPRQKHPDAVKSDKNEQHQTKCD